jgi:hypothetical protein
MSMKVILAIAVGIVLLCAAALPHIGTRALWIPYCPCLPQSVYDNAGFAFNGPECPTPEQIRALHEAAAHHGPMPQGFVITGSYSSTSAFTTGLIDWLGRHELELRVRDGVESLQSARLYIGDRIVGEATRENGGIVDDSVDAEAHLKFFLPWLPPYTVRLVKLRADGKESESSITIGRTKAGPK